MSTISIIIPVYNRESLIGRAIESVLQQSFSDFELLISDNCSDDLTAQVVKSFADQDSRIKFYRQTQNIGMWNNFNFLINKASGDYLKVLCSDDYLSKNALQDELKLMKQFPIATIAMGVGKAVGARMLNQKRLGFCIDTHKVFDAEKVSRIFLRSMLNSGINVFNYPAGVLVRRLNSTCFPLFDSKFGDVADIIWYLDNASVGGVVCHSQISNYIEFGPHQKGVKSLMVRGKKYNEMEILATTIWHRFCGQKVKFNKNKLSRINKFFRLKEEIALFGENKSVLHFMASLFFALSIMPLFISRLALVVKYSLIRKYQLHNLSRNVQ